MPSNESPALEEPKAADVSSPQPAPDALPDVTTDEHGRLPVETWAAKLATETWKFKAVKAAKRWPEGLELSRADYEAAIAWLDSDECVAR